MKYLILLLLISNISYAQMTCHSLYHRPSEEQIDYVLRELKNLKKQIYETESPVPRIIYNKKYEEIRSYISESEILRRIKLIELEVKQEQKEAGVSNDLTIDIKMRIAEPEFTKGPRINPSPNTGKLQSEHLHQVAKNGRYGIVTYYERIDSTSQKSKIIKRKIYDLHLNKSIYDLDPTRSIQHYSLSPNHTTISTIAQDRLERFDYIKNKKIFSVQLPNSLIEKTNQSNGVYELTTSNDNRYLVIHIHHPKNSTYIFDTKTLNFKEYVHEAKTSSEYYYVFFAHDSKSLYVLPNATIKNSLYALNLKTLALTETDVPLRQSVPFQTLYTYFKLIDHPEYMILTHTSQTQIYNKITKETYFTDAPKFFVPNFKKEILVAVSNSEFVVYDLTNGAKINEFKAPGEVPDESIYWDSKNLNKFRTVIDSHIYTVEWK